VQVVRANGLDIAVEEAGDGPPLVLLHGGSSGPDDFAAQLPLLRGSFRCYAPHARGHGGTRWDAERGFRYAWLVDDTLALADALGLETFHLLGFSMGAATALGLAARAPSRLRSLVLAGVSGEREPRGSVARRTFDPDRIARSDPDWAADLARRHDRVQGEGAWRRLLPAIAADIADQELIDAAGLATIRCPTLLLVGDRDPFVPLEQAVHLRRTIRDARLLVAPGCGHEVLRQRPAIANEALAGFYREQGIAVGRAGRYMREVPDERAS
jgi:pimeloyl-ACP methyl ester carboxylesterase